MAIEFEFDPFNLVPGVGGFAIAESFFSLGVARADTIRSEFLESEARKVFEAKKIAFQNRKIIGGVKVGAISFLSKLAARFAPAAASAAKKAAPLVAAGGAFAVGDVAVQAALAPAAAAPVAVPAGFQVAPGGIVVPTPAPSQRGRLVTATFRVLPNGTKIPIKVTPGGVALFTRDVTAAKRVKRVIMKVASSVGLRATSAGRARRKGKK